MAATNRARMMGGIPAHNMALYHQIRFVVGDPAVLLELPTQTAGVQRLLILRDIEMDRARRNARVDQVACPKDFEPAGGLSGDRETATAQAAAECLRRANIEEVEVDRSLPMIYVEMLLRAGLNVVCDLEWGVRERRSKDEQEIAWLQEAQAATEQVMRRACETVGRAKADADGVLHHDGGPLTSERLRSMIDIFPQNRTTLYNGDCTRTVVHGDVSDELQRMHAAVVAAKAAGTAATRAGVTGESVHEATIAVIQEHGFAVGLPSDDDPDEYTAMVHGTGHGIGLEVHEPPLLDFGGPELVVGDALTIEPGLYSRAIGGIRVEDLVIVTAEGCRNLNSLPEGLTWN